MNIHEYQAKRIFKDYGINVANGILVANLNETKEALDVLQTDKFILKAQIHAGGRGLGGGVKITKDKQEALEWVASMLNTRLITKQTSKDAMLVEKIYIEEAIKFKQEIYLSLTFDRNNESISLIVSKNGGISIEEAAQISPHLIKNISIDPQIGLCLFHVQELVVFLDINKELALKLHETILKLYQIYIQKDANLIEINPLVLTQDDEIYALDAKISFDDSALFRHPEILALSDPSQADPSENEAKEQKLNYIKFNGSVGCVVNGAGLAMATMDIIKELGADAANFLDVGGSATSDGVAKAFRLILKDKNVKVIFVNIFGGIVRCDRIASGVIKACKEIGLDVPVVVRLDGTNAKEAMQMLKESALKGLHASQNLLDGAKLAVKLAKETSL
ncbi:ADP-forming succinate--CoA ligase subunit beta [Campylobacter sp. RM9344]|uniref:Succinate--CoA ligase [ADP-forming] subunit beta n=1 Tax=Campylobacter californiensis TaxID=1032243 RepID=A0AAW3ZXG9_9BACT|nr:MULTISPECIES: ADP-forming succinate--CoA ligase subunit beta [unclassified Campylobacter]MBE2984273.1 ADP-forming succinate--CoA ligase subunit beta [Campylobacter sp. RM6883]MBE2994860.1 ADP-forming succinate--CoA ligase subunit beta [Campylobacter sp. RM6913]MBE3029502.1 ADP-forming succinate--CoA ligase subunit beta [Campylobacter sp. RM9344]MBE3607991.1 ADP-forming succinate--CoA ligase subunit beta [Campylobacter sp. RM9337]QCD50794.1 succinyl-CoA synthetase, beta subunit [Campylobacte